MRPLGRLLCWLRGSHDFPDDAAHFARGPFRHCLRVCCRHCGREFPVWYAAMHQTTAFLNRRP